MADAFQVYFNLYYSGSVFKVCSHQTWWQRLRHRRCGKPAWYVQALGGYRCPRHIGWEKQPLTVTHEYFT